jgi:hypothetical protein
MITVTIFSLTMPPQAMFQRTFARKVEADDYQSFFHKLGSCHIRRSEAIDRRIALIRRETV